MGPDHSTSANRPDPRHRASRIGIFLIMGGLVCVACALLALMQGETGLAFVAALYGAICARGTTVMYRIAATP